MKVAKFGGTSLADAHQIRKVLAIIQSDPERQCIVVSAPGKRNPEDQKITDLLYEWHRHQGLRLSSDEIRQIIEPRYAEIIRDLGLEFDLKSELSEINRAIGDGASPDYAASRGEYLNGKIVAHALGYEFIDATCIHLNQQGHYLKVDERLQSVLQGRKVVIPGFYGSLPDGSIKTFSRGGSDITGAIIARAVRADIYENWTDVSGLLTADPRVVACPRKIKVVTYRELRELSYMGANVLHEEAIFPAQEAGITIHIRNTNDPGESGTYIVANRNQQESANVITGVAGRKNFTVIMVEKKMMNQQVGFARRILAVLEENRISFEHMPSGIDTLSIIIDDKQLGWNLAKVRNEIQESCSPDTIETYPHMAMIAIVGQSMAHTPGIAAKIFAAVAKEGINIRMINQGSSEISIIIGVENNDCDDAVRAIHNAFFE